ncbi:MAG: XRE family transcriptional regulator [Chitinophagaceae bacterium]|nr:MAG: XRE family transcriptional regulator [Chitinophagaceae bacterium]
MHKQFEALENDLSQKLYKVFLQKFEGNQSAFARASYCSETTVRRVFNNKQRMTLGLFLRFCYALQLDASEILKSVQI